VLEVQKWGTAGNGKKPPSDGMPLKDTDIGVTHRESRRGSLDAYGGKQELWRYGGEPAKRGFENACKYSAEIWERRQCALSEQIRSVFSSEREKEREQ